MITKTAPLFLFACAVAAISGAVGGAAIDTTPIQKAGVGTPGYLRGQDTFAFATGEPAAQLPLPDHYPMTTPEGRIEVAELTTFGVRSQQRFAWSEPGPLPDAPSLPEPAPIVEEWPRRVAVEAETASAESAPAAPADEPGGARLIQVAAAVRSAN